jgi:hypothetical protein
MIQECEGSDVLRGREEVTGEWRKLLSEELHDLYCSSDIIRVIT